jgi:hypothetical protein
MSKPKRTAKLNEDAKIHDFIFAAINAHRRVNIARSGFLDTTGMCEQLDSDDADLDQYYCESAMAAARRLAQIEPATLAGVRAILNYVDEGERNQEFPWDEVGTDECELFPWHMTLHRSLAKALNRLTQSEGE